MTTTQDDEAELDSAGEVLAFARDSRVAADRAEADVLLAAVTWAEQHPPESIHDAATWSTRGGDCPLPLAGDGAPQVAEFCIAEFAAAIGRSTDSGRIKIAHGLELKYRLPRHWARVRSGTLEPWRACRVAAGGTTCSCNIAPLCRRHHRLKTHTSWTYTTIDPGTYLLDQPPRLPVPPRPT